MILFNFMFSSNAFSILPSTLFTILIRSQHSLHCIISTCFLSCLGIPNQFPLVATVALLATLSGCLVTVNGFPLKRTGQHVQRLWTQPQLVGHQESSLDYLIYPFVKTRLSSSCESRELQKSGSLCHLGSFQEGNMS